ncbi:F510_1955 family glycosylhydrolase [Actinomadura geliboluensis]|uniref:Exo-alpha-sialidase n=1 Tax=Actinomadura geliboluensis TaxID=882440 RepID=A0A5S4HB81_9ACTN|nr:hypothetical protein [Actinomadura geliboluensis]TMR42229.1 hypothetical protein ETD96_01375 [Actinomadura geliboluensis]
MNLRFHRTRAVRPLHALALIAGAIVLAACGTEADDAKAPAPSGKASAPSTEAEIGHVHGVAMDPADRSVYIAAHFGVFKIESPDRASRVGTSRQDTMGFTIVGPRSFVASGHPAMDDMKKKGVPPHLGLIRSADAGQTWTTVSEAGKADFHALQQAGQTLYAFDSQTQRVRHSRDGGRTWTLGERLDVNDLGAHKERPEEVYAATPDGLLKSNDSGGSFKVVGDAPVLTHVDVVDGRTLIGVAPDGQVQVKADGAGWQRLGRLPSGQAAAFTAVDERHLLAAAEDASVYESRDGGRTFNVLYGAR